MEWKEMENISFLIYSLQVVLSSVNWISRLVRFKIVPTFGIHHSPCSKHTFGFPSAQNQHLCWHWTTEIQDQRHFHVPLPHFDLPHLQRKNIPGSWAGIPTWTGLECSHSSSCQRAKSFSSKIISPQTGFFFLEPLDHRAIVWVRPWCLCNSYSKLSVKSVGV